MGILINNVINIKHALDTSDWVLHFIKISDEYIILVDLYQHYTIDGVFYLPSQEYLEH